MDVLVFWFVLFHQAFSTSHGAHSNSVNSGYSRQHKESIFAENGKGPQTEGGVPPPIPITDYYAKLIPHVVAAYLPLALQRSNSLRALS